MKTPQRITCHGCSGHGIVADYGDGSDFYGPKTCPDCRGTGSFVVYAGGTLARYPGGPFAGKIAASDRARVAEVGHA